MGYIGQRMSVRAQEAYDQGEMPFSKWTKAAILETLNDAKIDVKTIKKYSVQTLRDYFLYYSSWHHTGKYFSKTDFYGIDITESIDFEELDRLEQAYKEHRVQRRQERKEIKPVIALIKYGEWVGTRMHPKLEEHTSYAIIVGNVAHLADGKTKRLSGSHIEVIETFTRCPRGHKAEIDSIKAKMSVTGKRS